MMTSKALSFKRAASRSADKLDLSGYTKSSIVGINPKAYNSGRNVLHPEVCTVYRLISSKVNTVRYFKAFIGKDN